MCPGFPQEHMTEKKLNLSCLNCETPDTETPLLHLSYHSEDLWICSQCLPTLIHAPQKLTGKLQNADRIKPAEHHKH
jgi:hypothetical protein